MQMYFLKHCFLLLILLYSVTLPAQTAVITTGGSSIGSNGSLNFTVGQTAQNYSASTTATLSEGVQQPYEISIITQSAEPIEGSLEVSVFPNVTSSNLTLKIETQNLNQKFAYQLIDLNGVIIDGKSNIGAETQLSVNNLMAGTYLIKVYQNSEEIKLFKIIKK